MAAIQVRECLTYAEVMANARAIEARRRASRVQPVPIVVSAPPAAVFGHRRSNVITLQPDECLPDLEPVPPRPHGIPETREIIKLVSRHYNVSRHDVISERRTANVVRPRQVAMYLCKYITLKSLPHIGRQFGGRDHTTVLHAVRKIEALRRTDAALNSDLLALELELTPPPTADINQMALPFAGAQAEAAE